ncbi:MAG: hypothetical protein JWN38_628 [Candidatus Saccharibacteria bacterium]|nr:hypothetical protein [Candidatus Saccharibacteria bacterium]
MLKNKRTIAGIVIAVVVVLAIGGIANASSIKNQLNDWKLLPQPERLTELYFTDHLNLPASYMPGTPQTVLFSVHNLEGHRQTYTYTVTQTRDDGKQVAQSAREQLTLNEGATKATKVVVVPVDMGARCKISVALSTGEAISYWVTRG